MGSIGDEPLTQGELDEIHAFIGRNGKAALDGFTEKLRDYQLLALQRELLHFARGETEPGAICLPTGTGKSVVIAAVAAVICEMGGRVLVATPSLVIKKGLRDTLAGLLGPAHKLVVFSCTPSERDSLRADASADDEEAGDVATDLDDDGEEAVTDGAEVREIHYLGDGHFESAAVVIANVQALARNGFQKLHAAAAQHGARFKQGSLVRTQGGPIVPRPAASLPPLGFDLVIVDEAHHFPAASYQGISDFYTPSFRCLLSATFDREDKIGIECEFVYKQTLRWAKEKRYVKFPRIVDIDFSRLHFATQFAGGTPVPREVGADGPTEEQARRIAEQPEVQAAIAKVTLNTVYMHRKMTGTPHMAIIKASSFAHAQALMGVYSRQVFGREDGNGPQFPAVVRHISGYVEEEKRKEYMEMLMAGELHGLIVIGMLNEGFDWPLVSVVAFHYPLPNRFILVYQVMGRGLRPILFDPLGSKVGGKVKALLGKYARSDAYPNARVPASQEDLDAEQLCDIICPTFAFRMGKVFEDIDKSIEQRPCVSVARVPRDGGGLGRDTPTLVLQDYEIGESKFVNLDGRDDDAAFAADSAELSGLAGDDGFHETDLSREHGDKTAAAERPNRGTRKRGRASRQGSSMADMQAMFRQQTNTLLDRINALPFAPPQGQAGGTPASVPGPRLTAGPSSSRAQQPSCGAGGSNTAGPSQP
mmetsp:Transcript_20925/g.61913  ORF Transcript_20925/g.61913 Transcript_20925/m.61913 type:complete len:705 (-) Transcript_20925:151-2265(-)